jgi:hypothetical protein
VLSDVVGDRSQKSADLLVKRTAQRPKAVPLFIAYGLKFYEIASLKRYGKAAKLSTCWQKRTIAMFQEKILIPKWHPDKTTTSSRKTNGFSKKVDPLDRQMNLYFANFNFCQKHRSLGYKDEN